MATKEETRTYQREWARNNKERRAGQARILRAKDPEKFRARYRAWYAKNKDRRAAYCKKWKVENLGDRQSYERLRKRLWRYGVSYEQFFEMMAQQAGVCAVCEKPLDTSAHVDHNHNTQEVRGLLCFRCNAAIGLFYDNPTLLETASRYLKNYTPKIATGGGEPTHASVGQATQNERIV